MRQSRLTRCTIKVTVKLKVFNSLVGALCKNKILILQKFAFGLMFFGNFMRMVTCIDLLYTTYKRKSLENSSYIYIFKW